MTRSVTAIAKVALRHFWATRAILWVFAAACTPALLFPIILQADGTPTGRWLMIMQYTPIAIFVGTLMSAIWMAAYILSSEKTQLRLSMLRTKPLNGLSIWLGKWIATCLVQAMAILLGFVILISMLLPKVAQHKDLSTWVPFTPDESELYAQAQDMINQRKSNSENNHSTPSVEQMVNHVKLRQYRVAPGRSIDWIIPISQNLTERGAWQLRFQWKLDPMQRTPVSGTWQLTTTDQKILASLPVYELMDGSHTINWPELRIPPHSKSVRITFQNSDQNTSYVFFSTKSPIQLCQQSGSLYPNMLITALLLFGFCASAAAVSLTVSSFLSFPVTVFATHGILFAVIIASLAGQAPGNASMAHHATNHNAVFLTARQFLDQAYMVTASLRNALPFDRLANSLTITYREHLIDLAVLLLVIPLIMASLAHFQYMRQEVMQ
jgi:ABC-type transport system involved in multi-copper enzyme maturation permease subunit